LPTLAAFVGVAQRATAVLRLSPPSRPDEPGPPNPSLFVGVGHLPGSCTTSDSLGDLRSVRFGVVSLSTFTGVGHKPEPVPSVRGAKGRSWYAIPFRVIPALGQVADHLTKSSSKESCHVFHNDVSRS
jgi:hypothetical protein